MEPGPQWPPQWGYIWQQLSRKIGSPVTWNYQRAVVETIGTKCQSSRKSDKGYMEDDRWYRLVTFSESQMTLLRGSGKPWPGAHSRNVKSRTWKRMAPWSRRSRRRNRIQPGTTALEKLSQGRNAWQNLTDCMGEWQINFRFQWACVMTTVIISSPSIN